MQTWEQDPENLGDYKLDSAGKPVQTNSLRMPAYVRMKAKRLQWLYAPDTNYGSDFHLIRKRQSNLDISAVENTGIKAIQPIVDDGRAADAAVTFLASARDSIGVNLQILPANGIVEELVLQGVG